MDSQKYSYLKHLDILPNYFPKGSKQFIDLWAKLEHAFTSIIILRIIADLVGGEIVFSYSY